MVSFSIDPHSAGQAGVTPIPSLARSQTVDYNRTLIGLQTTHSSRLGHCQHRLVSMVI
jgi:hypothetical protein